MAENRFAKFKPTAPSVPSRANRFAKFAKPAVAPMAEDEALPKPAAAPNLTIVEKGTRNAPAKVEDPVQIEQALARVNKEPSKAQVDAGNYAKGHVKWNGMDVSIENPKGSIRKGVGKDGKPWESVLPAHYGYLKRSKGADDDNVDIYLGDKPGTGKVYVVDQQDVDGDGLFDEHKVIADVDSQEEAEALYEASFSDGKGRDRMRAVRPMSVNQFKTWMAEGDTKKPASTATLAKDEAEAAQPPLSAAALEADMAPDAPTAEPVSDIMAQVKDLKSNSKREGVFLSADAWAHAGEDVAGLSGLLTVDNFDGKGGVLLVRNKKQGVQALEDRKAGKPMQVILGQLTGAGTGKPRNGNAVVQQVDADGNVTRETLVNDDDRDNVAKDMRRDGYTVRIVTPEKAVKRRQDMVSAEQQARASVPAGTQAMMDRPTSDGPQESNLAGKRDLGETDAGGDALNKGLGNLHSPMTRGMLFGGDDELMSALGTVPDMAINAITGDGPVDPREVYAQKKAVMDRDRALYEEEHPVKAIAGEIAGSVVAGGPGTKFIAQAPTWAGKALRSGIVGGGIGGGQGALSTDGTLEDRAVGGATGAGMGAFLGSVLPPAFAASRALASAALTPIKSLANKESFAATKVAEALGRDKLSTTRVADRLQSNSALKSDLAVADVAGSNTGKLLRAAANVPSEGRQGLVQQIEYRQARQLARLQEDVGGAFGDPKQFHKTAETIVSQRKAAAKPLFDKAFNTATPFTSDLENVLSRPLTKQLVERAKIAAENRGETFKQLFVKQQPNGSFEARRVVDTEGLHRVKMTIDEMINGLKRGEQTGLANVNMRDLTILKKDLMGAIRNPVYKSALAQYAGDSAMVNALDDGFENGLKMDPEKIVDTLSKLSASEAKLWRLGFSRSISDTLRDTGRAGTNRADILASPKFLERLEVAVPDKAARRDLLQAIKLEQRMSRTRNAVQGNSTTAGQLAEGQEAAVAAQDAQDLVRAGGQMARGDVIGAAVNYLGRAKNYATGLRPEVADEIIKLLTSRSPKALHKAQRMIKSQADKLERAKGRRELYDGLRAIASGLFAGNVGEAVATP